MDGAASNLSRLRGWTDYHGRGPYGQQQQPDAVAGGTATDGGGNPYREAANLREVARAAAAASYPYFGPDGGPPPAFFDPPAAAAANPDRMSQLLGWMNEGRQYGAYRMPEEGGGIGVVPTATSAASAAPSAPYYHAPPTFGDERAGIPPPAPGNDDSASSSSSARFRSPDAPGYGTARDRLAPQRRRRLERRSAAHPSEAFAAAAPPAAVAVAATAGPFDYADGLRRHGGGGAYPPHAWGVGVPTAATDSASASAAAAAFGGGVRGRAEEEAEEDGDDNYDNDEDILEEERPAEPPAAAPAAAAASTRSPRGSGAGEKGEEEATRGGGEGGGDVAAAAAGVGALSVVSSSDPSEVIRSVAAVDVLCAADGRFGHHLGNVLYREQVRAREHRYEAADTEEGRLAVVGSVVDYVTRDNGGLFLKRLEEGSDERWVEVPLGDTLGMLSQAMAASTRRRHRHAQEKGASGPSGADLKPKGTPYKPVAFGALKRKMPSEKIKGVVGPHKTQKKKSKPGQAKAAGKLAAMSPARRWDVKLNELRRFKDKNGHVNVPPWDAELSDLYIWVERQRRVYSVKDGDKVTARFAQRRLSLERLGIEWKVARTKGWDDWMEDLKAFKADRGHLRVPANTPLGNFVSRQRAAYQKRKRVKATALTDERRDRLEDLGFVWEPGAANRDFGDWLRELKDFKAANGHLRVPARTPLHEFVSRQRRLYAKWKEGKATPLTDERRETLEELGLVWWPSAELKTWDEWMDMLKQFKAEHGHLRVPARTPLYNWIERRRRAHRDWERGKGPPLPAKRRKALADLGFRFWATDEEEEGAVEEVGSKPPKGSQEQGDRDGGSEPERQNKEEGDVEEVGPKPPKESHKQGDCDVGSEPEQQNKEKGAAEVGLGRGDQSPEHDVPDVDIMTSSSIDPHSTMPKKDTVEGDADEDWTPWVEKLRKFHAEHGHCMVPKGSTLFDWTERQRRAYFLWERGQETTLTNEQIELLEGLGFVWKPKRKGWHEHLEELKKFKRENGHCNVPHKKKKNDPYSALGSWLSCQKVYCRKWKGGEKVPISKDRVAALEELGVKWQQQRQPPKPREPKKPIVQWKEEWYKTWEKSFEELKWFQAENGHCNVPHSSNPTLARFTNQQRSDYKQYKEGKPSPLTEERIAAMEGIGFVWNLQKTNWKNNLEELRFFREVNGHLRVKGPLLDWVRKQRAQHKKWKTGLKSSMTEERCRLLEEVGVEWSGQGQEHLGRNCQLKKSQKQKQQGTKEGGDTTKALVVRLSELPTIQVPLADGQNDRNESHNDILHLPKVGEYHEQRQVVETSLMDECQKESQTKERSQKEEGPHHQTQEVRQPHQAPQRNVSNDKWYQRLEELRIYKETHGHANVPYRHGSLGYWVNNQRAFFKKMLEGKPSQLTEERIEALDQLGFNWKVRPSVGSNWEVRAKELRKYIEEHGDSNVPKNYPPNPELGIWVQNQRGMYSRAERGKNRSSMTADRIAILEDMGFEWQRTKKRSIKIESKPIATFEERLEELRKFCEFNGHCNVPRRSGSLGHWVGNMRRSYRKWEAGIKSGLTEKRINDLSALGFQWKVPAYGGVKPKMELHEVHFKQGRASWNERFEELRTFYETNGHCDIPRNAGTMGFWMSNQRKQYRLFMAGKKSTLTPDRRDALDSIGFNWEVGGKEEKGDVHIKERRATWNVRFEELRTFYETNGHCVVATKAHPLGSWVSYQRKQYRLLVGGIKSTLTPNRRDKLDSIGFKWEARGIGEKGCTDSSIEAETKGLGGDSEAKGEEGEKEGVDYVIQVEAKEAEGEKDGVGDSVEAEAKVTVGEKGGVDEAKGAEGEKEGADEDGEKEGADEAKGAEGEKGGADEAKGAEGEKEDAEDAIRADAEHANVPYTVK